MVVAVLLAGCTSEAPDSSPASGTERDGCAGTQVSLVQGDLRAVVYPITLRLVVPVRPLPPIGVDRTGPCSDEVYLVAGKHGTRIVNRPRGDGPLRTRPFRIAEDRRPVVDVQIPTCAGYVPIADAKCYGGVGGDTVRVVASLP